MPNVSAVFYAGQWPASWVVRAMTQRPGQPWRDVPGHCALRVNNTIYEFLASGFHLRPADNRDAWAIPLNITNVPALLAFVAACRKGTYDWPALFASLECEHLPGFLHLTDTRQGAMDCSRFLCGAGVAGGDTRLALNDTPSPNDALLALTTTLTKTKRTTP